MTLKTFSSVQSFALLVILICLSSGCATLHHVQLGDVDNRENVTLKPIEIKVSETGINLNDAKAISKLVLSQNDSKNTNKALEFIQYFQMGPHTGAGVYSIDYIKDIQTNLRSLCPSGYITGIMAIRETRKYPLISGEIVKIKAYCATLKGA